MITYGNYMFQLLLCVFRKSHPIRFLIKLREGFSSQQERPSGVSVLAFVGLLFFFLLVLIFIQFDLYGVSSFLYKASITHISSFSFSGVVLLTGLDKRHGLIIQVIRRASDRKSEESVIPSMNHSIIPFLSVVRLKIQSTIKL